MLFVEHDAPAQHDGVLLVLLVTCGTGDVLPASTFCALPSRTRHHRNGDLGHIADEWRTFFRIPHTVDDEVPPRGSNENSTAGLGQTIFVTQTKRFHPLGGLACIQAACLFLPTAASADYPPCANFLRPHRAPPLASLPPADDRRLNYPRPSTGTGYR